MDAQERRDIAAFFDDLAATRERVDWQMAGFNMCQPIRAVPKGARLGDYAKLPICDCPVVAVAKLRATKIMRADWPISFHLSNGSKAVEMARAVELTGRVHPRRHQRGRRQRERRFGRQRGCRSTRRSFGIDC